MITSRRRRSPVLIEGFLLACVATVCILIGYLGNGIDRKGGGSNSINVGIWYVTTCTGSKGCDSVSRKKQHDDGVIDDLEYVSVVEWQVMVTLSGLFIILVDLIYLLQLKGSVKTSRASPPILLLCVAIGVWLLLLVEYSGGTQIIEALDDKTSYRLFPWSLFFLGIGCIVSVAVAFINYLQGVQAQRYPTYNTERKTSLLEKNEMLISFLCLALHLFGHGSDALSIHYHTDDQNEAQNDTFISEERMGIWYINYCYSNGSCGTAGQIDYNNMVNNNMESSENMAYKSVNRVLDNFHTASTMVFTTIATLSTTVVVLLYSIGFRKGRVVHMKLHLMTFSMVSGCLLLHFCASEARWQVVANDFKLSSLYQAMRFPWGLLVLGISSILSLFVAGVNFVKLVFCNRDENGANILQEEEFITLSPAISTGNI